MDNKYDEFFKIMEEKRKIEEELIKSGIIDEVIEFLLTSDKVTDKFMWDDQFLYENEKCYEDLSTKLYLISSKAICYASKYRIDYEVNDDNYFRNGYCVFKYKDRVYFADCMSGQGTIHGLGVYTEEMCNEPLICEWDKILNDESPVYTEEYKLKLINNAKNKLNELIDNYGKDIIDIAFKSLNKGEK